VIFAGQKPSLFETQGDATKKASYLKDLLCPISFFERLIYHGSRGHIHPFLRYLFKAFKRIP